MAYGMTQKDVQSICDFYGYDGNISDLKQKAKDALLNKLCVVVSGTNKHNSSYMKPYRRTHSFRNHKRTKHGTRKNKSHC